MKTEEDDIFKKTIRSFLPAGGLMQMHDEIMNNPIYDSSSATFAKAHMNTFWKKNEDGTWSINRPHKFSKNED